MDVKIEVYVMYPSNEHWIENSKKREDMENIEVYENQKKQMEFPNPAEGFDAIFEVVDDEIILRMDDIKPEIVKQARQELTEEDTRIRREDEPPLPIVINEQLTPEEKIIWQRIKAGPESLLKEK